MDVLVHHAAQMDVRRSVENPAFDADVNILGSLNLVEAARQGGVRQVLFASTGGAIYGEQDYFPADEQHPARPVSPYGVSKLSFERYLFYFHVAYGLDATCLRYANVYGERQNPHGEAGVVAIFLSRLLAGQAPTINGEGLQTRDYVHVSDVVRANLLAAGKPGFHIYNVGTGVETSVVDALPRARPRRGQRPGGEARAGQAGRAAALGDRRPPDQGRARLARAAAAAPGDRAHGRLVPRSAPRRNARPSRNFPTPSTSLIRLGALLDPDPGRPAGGTIKT